jgi:FtsZ-interacting cell division protein ZipA
MIKNILYFVLVAVFIIAILYFGIWIKKNVNYNFFYRDVVKQTIREMVKPEYLK